VVSTRLCEHKYSANNFTGNGSQEHPTQAFLDLFTIREELGTVNDLTITFMGDLKYGRTVHSLAKLLQLYHVRIQVVCPPQLALPKEFRDKLVASGCLVVESAELTPEIIARSDVLYCTRVQKERFEDLNEYEHLKNVYVVNNSVMKHAKSHMIVMHPLPRTSEISEEVDFDNRAAYFRQVCSIQSGIFYNMLMKLQMKYGLYCRMALLALVLA
jgi:carbamoyl-phosphate synthase/aspartate carbamoyltransferase